jgi:hypothetical protein
MLSIAEYNPFFIKKTFNLPEYKPKNKKRIVVVDYDHLFYELYYKINKYDITHIDYQTNERQEKIKIAVEIEKLKIKNKDEIIQNLMYEKKIDLKTFNALCVFYKINLLYIKDNIFIRMNYSNHNDNTLYMDNNKFVEQIDVSKKYEVNLDKPLRCASYYKIDDLRLISNQLHLPTENIKKQQLYDSIDNVLSKLNI